MVVIKGVDCMYMYCGCVKEPSTKYIYVHVLWVSKNHRLNTNMYMCCVCVKELSNCIHVHVLWCVKKRLNTYMYMYCG